MWLMDDIRREDGPSGDQPISPASRSTGPRRERNQGGFSFVENLIVILLASTVILAIAGGMLTLIKVNRVTSEVEQIEIALGNYTEQLVASTYIPCGLPIGVQPTPDAYNALPERWVPERSDMTARVTDVQFWDDSADAFVGTCPATGDQATQRLDVEVTLGERSGSGQIVIAYHGGSTP